MSFKFIFFAVLYLFYCSASLGSQQDPVRFKLKNQMEVYLLKDNTLPIVSHILLYKVGSANDPNGMSGLAHYLEHMMFKSTPNTESILSAMHSAGTKYNAITSDYFTIYYQVGTKDSLEKIMKIESERMQSINLFDQDAKVEKKVVLQERRMRVDSRPYALLEQEINAAFYRNDKSWNTMGWAEEIQKISTKDLDLMHKKYYTPSNAVLILCGDIEEDHAQKLVQKYYGNIKKRFTKVQNNLAIEPEHKSDISLKMINGAGKERMASYCFDAPNVMQKGYESSFIASYVLGNAGVTKMRNELIDNLSLALDLNVSYNYLTKSAGKLCINVIPFDENVRLDSIFDSINGVIDQLLRDGISSKELEISKNIAKFDLVSMLDGTCGRALNSAVMISLGLKHDHFSHMLKEISAVNLEQVNLSISELFNSRKVIGFLDKQNV